MPQTLYKRRRASAPAHSQRQKKFNEPRSKCIGTIAPSNIPNMPLDIVRKPTPEEEELLRKREELATIRAALAERELELADFRAQLKSFEGRYLRQVVRRYAGIAVLHG